MAQRQKIFLAATDPIDRVIIVGKTTIQMYPDGRKHREGIKPDIEIEQTIEDVIQNKDPVLEKGIEILAAEINLNCG